MVKTTCTIVLVSGHSGGGPLKGDEGEEDVEKVGE